MAHAEFEERAYEAPLYNQLERGNADVFTPGQVLESLVGFDRGLYLADAALWETLGYDQSPRGSALAYYDFPLGWGPRRPRVQLPRFRLNLFLQAKRPVYYRRRPRTLRNMNSVTSPLWAFRVTERQQQLLEALAKTTGRRAHVAYASAAFHTYSQLFTHTKHRTIVENSTFPSATALAGHKMWYYDCPGSSGIANPDPERIEEAPLLARIRRLAASAPDEPGGDLAWLDSLAKNVVEAVSGDEIGPDAISSQFMDDVHTLERIAESYGLRPSFRAYAQVQLFAMRFDLKWLVVTPRA